MRPGISDVTDSEIVANSRSNYDLPMRGLTSSTLGTLESPVRTPVHQRGFRIANRRGRARPPDSLSPRRPKISSPVGPLRRMNALDENRPSDQITLDEALRDHKLDPKLDDSEIRVAMREMGLETGALRYMKPARRSSELLSTARPLTELLNAKPSVRAVSAEGDVATSADISRSTTPVVEKQQDEL
ncbi:hypothetical protein H2199_004148 [Coniosporium tulheliwenetii]|nr:hypothetical protein H2199_004148 [Cladosporium sp. JES 115]